MTVGIRSGIASALAVVCSLVTVADLTPDEPEQPPLKITNIERFNTPADEDDPCLAPSGLAFYFTSNAEGDFNLMMAVRRRTNRPFSTPRPIEELNGDSDDISPFPMPPDRDGSEYIYFASQQDADNFDVFFTRRLRPNQPFQGLAIAGVHQICTPEDELHPWVSPDYRELYFSRKTEEGWRIGYARSRVPRAWDKVDLLDLPVGFYHPSVSRDGKTMFLQGPVGDGRLGLFVSTRSGRRAPWSQPRPLTLLNDSSGERGTCSPSLSPSGSVLFFASDRPGGKGGLDLYYVSLADLKKAMSPKDDTTH